MGLAGLGTEAASWYFTKRTMQGAADAGAATAAAALAAGAPSATLATEAKSIAAGMFGFQREDAYFKADEGAKTAPKVKF